MEELLTISNDARITVLNAGSLYQVVVSWNYKNGAATNDFVETWGKTVEECVEQLKKDIKHLKLLLNAN